MAHGAAELGHHHPGFGRFHAVQQNRGFGLAGQNRKAAAARPAPRGHRALVDALMRRHRLIGLKVKSRIRRKAGAAVAMAAIDLEIGARPCRQRFGRVIPARQPRWHSREAGQLARRRPMLQLAAIVQIGSRWPDRRRDIVLAMALLALVDIGHRIVERPRRALGIDELHRQPHAGALQHGIGATGVPDIG